MADRDVETIRSRAKFVATLRRVADAIERKEAVRIQVAAKRFSVPAGATLSVEHEASGADEELELQLRWQNTGDDTPAKTPKRKAPARRKLARRR
jgi:amphi-Trp domain-containing protein